MVQEIKQNKLFIFDFDGVVLDTEKYHFKSWQEVFKTKNADITWQDYESLKSSGREEIIKALAVKSGAKLTPQDIEQFKIRKGEIYSAYIKTLSEKDYVAGVMEFIAKARSLGIKTAIGSSSVQASKIIKDFGIEHLFDTIIDGSMGLPSKPAPDTFETCANRLGYAPKDCIVFEDSIMGVYASENANMKSVYIGQIKNQYSKITTPDFTNLTVEEVLSI